MLKNVLISFILLVLFSGCSQDLQKISNLKYNTGNVNIIREIQYGVIKKTRNITITDDGKGTLLGGIIGGLAGSKTNNKKGAIAGAVIGASLTNKMIESAGQELTIELDDKKTILVGVSGNFAMNYLRVRLLMEDSKLIALEPSTEPLKNSLINSLEKLINKPEAKPQEVVNQVHNSYKQQKNSPEQFKLINTVKL